LGLADPSRDSLFVATSYVILLTGSIALALRGRGLDRRAGSIIIATYFLFAGVLATR